MTVVRLFIFILFARYSIVEWIVLMEDLSDKTYEIPVKLVKRDFFFVYDCKLCEDSSLFHFLFDYTYGQFVVRFL